MLPRRHAKRCFNNPWTVAATGRDSPGLTCWLISHGRRGGFGCAAQDSAGTGTCWAGPGIPGGDRSHHGLVWQVPVVPVGGQRVQGGESLPMESFILVFPAFQSGSALKQQGLTPSQTLESGVSLGGGGRFFEFAFIGLCIWTGPALGSVFTTDSQDRALAATLHRARHLLRSHLFFSRHRAGDFTGKQELCRTAAAPRR